MALLISLALLFLFLQEPTISQISLKYTIQLLAFRMAAGPYISSIGSPSETELSDPPSLKENDTIMINK